MHFKFIGIQSWVENFILQRLCGGIRAALLFSLHTSTLWGSVELTFVNKGSTFERSSIVFLLTGKKGTADTRTQCLHLLHQRPQKKKKAQVVCKPMEMSPWYLSWIKVKEKIKGNDSSKSTCSYLISLYVQNKEKRKLMRHQLKKKSTSLYCHWMVMEEKEGIYQCSIGHLFFFCPWFFSVGSRSKISSPLLN